MDSTLYDLVLACCRDPFDDTPRLVAADRMDELGMAERAEFVRLQVDWEALRCRRMAASPHRKEATGSGMCQRQPCPGCLARRERGADLVRVRERLRELAKCGNPVYHCNSRAVVHRHHGVPITPFLLTPRPALPAHGTVTFGRGFVSRALWDSRPVHGESWGAFLQDAARVFTTCPLTEAGFISPTAAVVADPLGDPAVRVRRAWWAETKPLGVYGGDLPPGAYALLDGYAGQAVVAGHECRWYENYTEACAAAGRAVWRLGRKLAGLPDIEPHKEGHA